MKIKYKRAFSLTEILIVLVIVAVLFAAMTPIVTRRAKSDLAANDSVWRYVDSDPEHSSYFHSGVSNWASSLFVGENANNNADNAKLVINSEANQNQIQLRYSPDALTRGKGVAVANILLKPHNIASNIYFGSDLSGLHNNSYGNAIAGINGFNIENNAYLSRATIIGNHAASGSTVTTWNNLVSGDNDRYNIFVGANAGQGARALDQNDLGNIYIGESAGAGAAKTVLTNHNIVIGSKAMSQQTYGQNNIFLGAGVGNSFGSPYNPDDDLQSSINASKDNTIIGSLFTGGSDNNTVIGYGTYHKNVSQRRNLTAIGYGACDAVGNTNGKVTCIGAGSGSSYKYFSNSIENSGSHVYLGGPSQNFGGRAPLEVHYNSMGNGSVVLNSNLAVRGRVFLNPNTNTNNVQLYPLTTRNNGSNSNSNNYKCSVDDMGNNILGYSGYYCKQVGLSEPVLDIGYDSGACSGGYEGLGGCVSITSDQRLKSDITLNNDGLQQVLNLVPYNYTFKSDKTKAPQVGVIAQDLQKIFPSSVSKGEDGFLRIRWDEMFYAMINAIKTLGAKIEAIASDILKLENDAKFISSAQKSNGKKIAELNRRLNKLEKRSNK